MVVTVRVGNSLLPEFVPVAPIEEVSAPVKEMEEPAISTPFPFETTTLFAPLEGVSE